jgi:hypothetical protein
MALLNSNFTGATTMSSPLKQIVTEYFTFDDT